MAKSKGASAPPKSRPASSASATQAAPDAAPATLSAFSPRADLFALLTQALDRHRLRIYASPDARLTADYVLPAARAEALAWGALPHASSSAASPEAPKKRKKGTAAANAAAVASSSSAATPVVALGLADGTVALFSPTHGRVLRSLSDKAPAAGPRGVRALHFSHDGQSLHAACADSVVRKWSLTSPDAPPERTPAPQVSALGETSELLAASHAIDELGGAKRSWTGHASPITHLTALAAPAPAASFVSAASNDRVLTLWGQAARPLATLPMTAPARQIIALSTAERALVLAITTSGDAGIYAVPAALDGSAKRTPALERVSSVTLKASKKAEATPLLDAAQVGNQLYVAALVKGAKLVLERTVSGLRPAPLGEC
jgi:U3 small nucleolar RNA-associated protein 5